MRNDPPTVDELAELMSIAREVVDGAIWPEHAGVSIRRAIFVGGTATNVARLGILDRAHLNEDLSTLSHMTADEVVEHFGVRPRRARQLAAGVAIVSALLDRFLLGQAEVSEASLRDGVIIAALARGEASARWARGPSRRERIHLLAGVQASHPLAQRAERALFGVVAAQPAVAIVWIRPASRRTARCLITPQRERVLARSHSSEVVSPGCASVASNSARRVGSAKAVRISSTRCLCTLVM